MIASGTVPSFTSVDRPHLNYPLDDKAPMSPINDFTVNKEIDTPQRTDEESRKNEARLNARIVRLTQLYNALSQCNHAVVHAVSVESLLPEICRSVVEFGRMKMAWIGMVDEASGRVRPVAAFGEGKKYTEGIHISIHANEPSGRGPVGVAIRENRPVWCHDFQNDPSTASWRERGSQYGWAAIAALPLHREAKPVGALCIYSPQVEIFDDDGRNLLKEMACELSFALDNLARRDERRRMAVALLAEKEKFRTIFNSTNDAIFIHDLKTGAILDVNDGVVRLYGYTAEEMLSLNLAEISLGVPPYSQADALDWIGKAAEGTPQVFEWYAKHKSGRLFWVEVSMNRTIIEDENRLVVVVRDITERKRMESELKISEEKYRTLFENANDAIFLMHGDIFIDCNTHALQLFGCPLRDQLVGHPPYEFSPPLQPDGRNSQELAKSLIKTALAGRNQDFEWTHKKLDGTLFSAEVSLNAVLVAGREVLQARVRDITERKRMEDALRKKNTELERFTYTVSHDLKSPLVTIKAFLGYLEEDLKKQKPDAVAKDLGFINSAAEKMALLLNELLQLARVGHNNNNPVESSLQEIVQEAMCLVAGQMTDRNVQVQITPDPILIFGDRTRLVEVFQNLLDNAVKFLGDQPSPKIEIGWEADDAEMVLFVRDNGKGIDKRHQSKLFGLFEKLDPKTPGVGMGLAMVKRIIEMHGGNIRAQSDGIGCGTTIWFTLAKTKLLK